MNGAWPEIYACHKNSMRALQELVACVTKTRCVRHKNSLRAYELVACVRTPCVLHKKPACVHVGLFALRERIQMGGAKNACDCTISLKCLCYKVSRFSKKFPENY